ncbi:MAG TPA: hypothetical protein VFU86_23150 [Terriglobales bacterium]|nr:hypothetical protein [Terriglobales bacterium]
MKRIASLGLLFFFISSALAVVPTIEPIGKFQGNAPDAVKAAIADTGFRVTGGDGAILAEIWPAKSALATKTANSTAVYPEFVNGAFYGIVTFPKGGGDYRGQKVSAGTYTMRYQLLPDDGNHLGVAPNPDFFLLIPIDADTDPSAKLEYATLVRLSAKSAGTAHPAPFQLATPAAKPVYVNEDQGHTIAYFPINTSTGTVNIGMILSGASDEQQ